MALRSSRASWASQMTVVVRIIRAPRWAGPCGQLGGVVAVAAAAATARARKRLARGSVPSRAGITACGGGDRFIRGEVARRLGLQRAHHAGYAPAGPR
jgi:hypothetical protein